MLIIKIYIMNWNALEYSSTLSSASAVDLNPLSQLVKAAWAGPVSRK